jgi:prepilin-type N-terminal cleavage/methylation domain-containing protein
MRAPFRTGEAGVTLVELMMALGVLGVLVAFGTILMMRMTAAARATQVRATAESVLAAQRNAFVRAFETRLPDAPAAGGAKASRAGIAPAFFGGTPFRHGGTQLSLTQRRERGFATTSFEMQCEPIPANVKGKLAAKNHADFDLSKALASDDLHSLGSVCRGANVTCPAGKRPILRVGHTTVDEAGRVVPKATHVAAFPPPTGRTEDVLAGGFCFVRSAALEYLVAFQQVILDGDRIVYLKRDALVPLSNEEPYAASRASGITYLAPGD